VLDLWGRTLDAVEAQNLSLIDREIDWAIKHRLVERYRERNDLDLASARVAQLDLAYHDIRRGRGLFDLLQRKGMVERVTDDGEIELAKDSPPQTTRAKLRGDFIAAAQAAGRDFTVDWVHLKLNDQASAPCCARTRSGRSTSAWSGSSRRCSGRPGCSESGVRCVQCTRRRFRCIPAGRATSRRGSGRAARPARPAPWRR
jgi:hypothetical protein